MERTKKVLQKRKRAWIIATGIVLGCMLIVGSFLYPSYVHYVAGNYAKKFAIVLNSHDMNQYDAFFEEDTLFVYGNEEVTYAEVRESIAQKQDFKSEDSYGHLEEDAEIFGTKEYRVSLMLPVCTTEDGFNGIVEGWFILRRENVFFFEIKEVGFYHVGIG